jgi:hypothetical protein
VLRGGWLASSAKLRCTQHQQKRSSWTAFTADISQAGRLRKSAAKCGTCCIPKTSGVVCAQNSKPPTWSPALMTFAGLRALELAVDQQSVTVTDAIAVVEAFLTHE